MNEKKKLEKGRQDTSKKECLDEEFCQKITRIFKVLSDPTRVKILNELSGEELCVQDLSSLLDMSQSAVSHQLRILRDANIVKYDKRGRKVFYSLADEHVEKLLKMGIEHAKEGKRW